MREAERPIVFPCAGETLVGMVHPGEADARHGVVIVVGGPQYRVGSHRQFVELARALAAAGVPALRFDCRGMGDSGGAWPGFENISADIRAAIDAFFAEMPGIERVVLWGLCDAVSAILLYAHSDPRIAGLVLLNPWVRTEAGFARTQLRHYYLGQLTNAAFWRRLLAGGVRLGPALADAAMSLRRALGGRGARTARTDSAVIPADLPLPERMACGFAGFRGPVLLILSGNDLTAREFEDAAAASARWRSLLGEPRVARCALPDADHTFSRQVWKRRVAEQSCEWIRRLPTPEAAGRPLSR